MPRRRTRARRQQGLAFLEAVMMLPAFAVGLWACVWLHGMFAARHTANVQARACAMAWAAQGCRGVVPADCGTTPAYGEASEAIIPDEVSVGGTVQPGEHVRVADALARLPVIGSQLAGLGRFDGILGRSADQAVARPSLLGGGSDTLFSHSYALCAPDPINTPALLTPDIFCGTMPCGFPGCEASQANPAVGCVSGP